MKAQILVFAGLAGACLMLLVLQGRSFVVAQETSAAPASKWPDSYAMNNPVEVGLVRWQRDFEAALRSSQESGKPLFVLFQEVPGCAGCRQFGREVLSHPLMVEAIQSEFEPVLVLNNRSEGSDAALLKRYQEPAWNYQVVRFLDAQGKDLIPRRDQVWQTHRLADRMIAALEEAKRPVPRYLHTLAATGDPSKLGKAAFAMACFWTGEYELGRLDGVVATEAGWLEGREVTLVHFDPEQTSLQKLTAEAAQVRCAQKVYTTAGQSLGRLPTGRLTSAYRTASAQDQKRQIARWQRLKMVPGINAMQLTKVNALAPRNRQEALLWLSPNQRSFLESSH